MRKSILVLALAIVSIACQKEVEVKDFKTAYVDTSKLLEEYNEAKDIEAKYKNKSEEMGRELEAEVKKFQKEAENFEKNAQTYGMQWAQQKGRELQQREQELSYAQQAMMQTLQRDSAKEMDTLVKSIKKFIKDYGKDKGYNYIYGTGDAASILYAKDEYDVTDEIIKLLNDKYKSKGKTDAKETEVETSTEETK